MDSSRVKVASSPNGTRDLLINYSRTLREVIMFNRNLVERLPGVEDFVVAKISRRKGEKDESRLLHEYLIAEVYPSEAEYVQNQGKMFIKIERNAEKTTSGLKDVSEHSCRKNLDWGSMDTIQDVTEAENTKHSTNQEISSASFPIVPDDDPHMKTLTFVDLVLLSTQAHLILGEYNLRAKNCHYFSALILDAAAEFTGRAVVTFETGVQRRRFAGVTIGVGGGCCGGLEVTHPPTPEAVDELIKAFKEKRERLREVINAKSQAERQMLTSQETEKEIKESSKGTESKGVTEQALSNGRDTQGGDTSPVKGDSRGRGGEETKRSVDSGQRHGINRETHVRRISGGLEELEEEDEEQNSTGEQ